MNLFLKRLADITLASVISILIMPFFVVISIAIKFDSKGPVFFKQNRRTKDGKIFQMLKFRSMIQNAENIGTGLFNYQNDPRVTTFGAFLRKTSIDELPQLLNVIRGDMSLVGPRPCVTYELGDYETLNKKFKKRFRVKAGITGWAQIKGRNSISWREKVVLDNEYVDLFDKYGILIDLYILVKSFFIVVKKDEIYEEKIDQNITDEEAAKLEEEEIIRIAHIPD